MKWGPRRTGGPGLGHWRCTGPRSPEHRRERARAVRAVSQSPFESAAEDGGPSGRRKPSLPVCWSPTCSSLTPGCHIFFGHNFMDFPSRAQRRKVVRLAPAKNGSDTGEKVDEGAGRLPGIWKLEWSRIKVLCGVAV